MPTTHGAIRIFRFAGIDVYLHWLWFVVAYYEIQARRGGYSSIAWNVAEYLAIFVIVTLHEFGHSLACRQVGGQADHIVLWPLGGVAYVAPPQRPGATLWSIAAGPLVNVVLLFPLFAIALVAGALKWNTAHPNANALILAVLTINVIVLLFNLLPVFPLDGGQILRSVLWFAMGRARSLFVATVIGFLGAAGLVILALLARDVWMVLIAAFVGLNCWNGFKQARVLSRAAQLSRRPGYACPSCHAAPPFGPFWLCAGCRQRFDTFETYATCPQCGMRFATTRCFDCGSMHPIGEWASAAPASNAL
jgi:Zn-dependent protease